MKRIVLEDGKGNIVKIWPSIAAATKDLGVGKNTIHDVIYGKINNSPLIPGVLRIDGDNEHLYNKENDK